MTVTALPKTQELLQSASGSVFHNYAVGLSYKGETTFHYGACGQDSLFDLASLTKVLSTTTLCLLAEDRKILSIETPVQKFIPAFPDSRVLLSHLLNHSSGLPDWLPLHTHFHEEKSRGLFDAIKTPPLARKYYEEEIVKSHRPENFEKNTVYSDLGFMLLCWALEEASQLPIDALFQEWLVIPNKLFSLQFLPTSPNVVPTEDCPWRGHVLRGEVHDDNCYVLGGISGHAGLFGNARDVIRLSELWLQSLKSGSHAEKSFLNPALTRKYWNFTHIPHSTRTLGWDGVSPTGSSAGKYFSSKTRGHLGFTGTSLWIDPEKDLVVTLLTNRVYPTRKNESIKEFRPLFHDTLLMDLGLAK